MVPPISATARATDFPPLVPAATPHAVLLPAADDAASGTGRHARAAKAVERRMLRAMLRLAFLAFLDIVSLVIVDALLHGTAAFSGSGALRDVLRGGAPVLAPQAIAGLLFGLAVAGAFGEGDARRDPWRLFVGCLVGLMLPVWDAGWSRPADVLPPLLVTVTLLTAVLALTRGLVDVLVHYTVPFRSAAPRTLLVGPSADCLEMLGRPAFSDEYGFRLVGIVDAGDAATAGEDREIAELEERLLDQGIDTIVLCGIPSERRVAAVLRAATIAECEVLAVNRSLELPGVHPEVVWRQRQPFIEYRAASLRGSQMIAKRILDVVLAAAGLVVLAPLMMAVALAVRLDSPGPVVFGQPRMGRHGRVFRCFKFRSMRRDAEAQLHADPALYAEYVRNDFKLPPERDPRITRVGRVLRRTSLDELPQLWNVLRGDMSLVGPRPVVVNELTHYGAERPLFLSLKPGVTGAWQVNGRSDVAYPGRALVELEYVRTWSLGRDIRILLQTLPAVLAQRGAH